MRETKNNSRAKENKIRAKSVSQTPESLTLRRRVGLICLRVSRSLAFLADTRVVWFHTRGCDSPRRCTRSEAVTLGLTPSGGPMTTSGQTRLPARQRTGWDKPAKTQSSVELGQPLTVCEAVRQRLAGTAFGRQGWWEQRVGWWPQSCDCSSEMKSSIPG